MLRDEEEYSKPKILYQIKVTKNAYEEICPTALVTSYPRIFTDIPHEQEISNWLNMHNLNSTTEYKT